MSPELFARRRRLHRRNGLYGHQWLLLRPGVLGGRRQGLLPCVGLLARPALRPGVEALRRLRADALDVGASRLAALTLT